MQHAGGEWRGELCIRNCSFRISKNHDRLDAVALAFGDSIGSGSELAEVPFQRDVGQQNGYLDENPVMRNRSRKLLNSENSESELIVVRLETGTVLTND